MEFLELYDGGVGNTSLANHVLVFYNGSGNVAYRAIDLDGMSTDADGFFLVANVAVPGISERVSANTGVVIPSNGLQNSEEGLALYSGLDGDYFTTSSSGGQVPTKPGDVDLTNGAAIVDALVYQSSDSSSMLVEELGITGGGAVNEGADGTKDTASVGRVPDGGTAFDQSADAWSVLDPPTPGFANEPSGELDLLFDVLSVQENAGVGAVQATVIRDSSEGALLVSFEGNDATELDFPSSVTIPDGAFELIFPVDVLDDGAADGTQTVVIIATAPGLPPSAPASIDVLDDNDSPTLVINEIYGDVFAGQDPNRDGVTDFQGDEFLELVNISGGVLDISGWELSDNERVRHVFPAGSILGVDCAVVIFGSGQFTEGVRADFGNALVQKATDGALGLNDTGDEIVVRQAGTERAGASYGEYTEEEGDLTRSPELTGGFVAHGTVGQGLLFSPGTRADTANNFCDILEVLTLSGQDSIGEDGGAGAAQFNLIRSGSTNETISVQLGSSDLSEVEFQSMTVEIPAGSASIVVLVDAVDDAFVDGDQPVELVANSVGYVSALQSLIVADAGGDTGHILINEIDSDTPGQDVAEFIELYDGGIGNVRLDGYVLALYNGSSNGDVYEVYDLDGQSTNADGFFVLGHPDVPNVDLTDRPFLSYGILQGGPDGLALYIGNAADHFVGSGITGSPVDAVAYGTFGEGSTFSADLGLGGQSVGDDSASRSIARLPDGGNRLDLSGFGSGVPTPGASNMGEINDTPYDTWAAGFNGLGSRLDDVDNDGLLTIVEYALGKNPLVPDRDGLPEGMLVNGQMQISVPKGAPANTDPALSYLVEASTDLQNWSAADTSELTNDAATLTVAYIGAATRVYLRLSVQLQ